MVIRIYTSLEGIFFGALKLYLLFYFARILAICDASTYAKHMVP